ncbi:hypothetical protein BSPWISOXPB_5573 [uncultured Gammaproteobacteria bacterium]|nr:hypothetical protein BSPWISOXPB_5573 [uncultured Gammaproteobacteria bacterium]
MKQELACLLFSKIEGNKQQIKIKGTLPFYFNFC